MKKIITTLLFFIPIVVHAQVVIHGEVIDNNNEPIVGANVYIKGSYDGASTNGEGAFSFETGMHGSQTLVATFVGYKKYEQSIQLNNGPVKVNIILQEDINKIDEVVISAGAFEASDKKKAVVLKPMDIVSTAGATADITGVMNNLPGTQTVGEDGKLYVRGGDSREVKTFIDGMLVPKAFGVTPANVPSRFRFSPFLFEGTFFSTGGYSAEYGNALSSVLLLETNDLPERTQTDISLMSVGTDINQTVRWDESSLYAQIQYTNLGLYYDLVPQEYKWKKAPRGINSIVQYKRRLKNNAGIKFYSNYQSESLNITQPYFMDVTQNKNVQINDRYLYNNFSFNSNPERRLNFRGGMSMVYYDNKRAVAGLGKHEHQFMLHSKWVSELTVTDDLYIKAGTEIKWNNPQTKYSDEERNGTEQFENTNVNPAIFAESDYFVNDHIIIRPGVRAEYTSILGQYNVAPRLSMAYRINKHEQVSLAIGRFFQTPSSEYWITDNDLDHEVADHYILNYQYNRSGKIFRSEVYYKKYHNLTKFGSLDGNRYDGLNNRGKGFAKGLELFWRDRSSLEYGDYWVSYSFLDTKRDYQDFPGQYTPPYASKHNGSIVYKHFVQSIRSQVGITYHFTSGRYYDDPNTATFMDRKTSTYHDLSMNYSFLLKPNIIIHASVSNVLGLNHDFGRQYSAMPNERGVFDSVQVGPAAKRFIFLGCFITLSKDPEANQLNNL